MVRAHTTGKVSRPVAIKDPGSLLTASLPVRGYEIFSAFPLTSLSSKKHGDMSIANLGLLGKMAGAAAIFMSSVEERENGRVMLDTRVKAFGVLGKFLFYRLVFMVGTLTNDDRRLCILSSSYDD